MNKKELAVEYAVKANVTKKDAERQVGVFIDSIRSLLSKYDCLKIAGFGNFYVKERGERSGRNPKTGKKIKIGATKILTFKSGKALKNAINGIASDVKDEEE